MRNGAGNRGEPESGERELPPPGDTYDTLPDVHAALASAVQAESREAPASESGESTWIDSHLGAAEVFEPSLVPGSPRSGAVLDDRYLFEHPIGTGSMGNVWRGRALDGDRPVAIKVLRGDVGGLPDIRARFEREARAIEDIDHPALVPVLDAGVWHGRMFLVMELLEGETLRELLARERLVPVDEVEVLLGPVFDALEHAHGRGVVHRDLKPENIYLDARFGERRTRVLDFGLAKVSDQLNITRSDTTLGTPAYMAPEQLRSAKLASPRSDQYALAAIIYQMLEGRLPHRAKSIGALALAKSKDPPSPFSDRVDETVAATIIRALSRQPDERYESVAAFGEALFGRSTTNSGRSDEKS